MNVRKLIELLAEFDPDLEVVLMNSSGHHVGAVSGVDPTCIHERTVYTADTFMRYVEGSSGPGLGGQHRAEEEPTARVVVLAEVEG